MIKIARLLAFSLWAILTFPAPSHLSAQTPTEAVVPVSEVQRQVVAALAASNATLEAIKRRSDRELRRQLFEIEDLQAQIAELDAAGEATSQELEALRNELALEQQRFVEELAERDRVYADEIASYRRAVEDIAATPEGLAALERFNAGEEAEALAILDRLRAARDLAAARRITLLAVEAWKTGKVTTQSVINRYEELTRLDSQSFEEWNKLAGYQIVAGDVESGKQSAIQASHLAQSEFELIRTYSQLADIEELQGNPEKSLDLYYQSLKLSEQRVRVARHDWEIDHSQSVILNRIGQLLRNQGKFDVALRYFERAKIILDRLSTEYPLDARFQQGLSNVHLGIGDIFNKKEDFSLALESYRNAAEISTYQMEVNSEELENMKIALLAHDRIGKLLLHLGNDEEALPELKLALEIAKSMAKADSGNVYSQMYLSVSLIRFGDLMRDRNNHIEAQRFYLESLMINEKQYAFSPDNFNFIQQLIGSLDRIGDNFVELGNYLEADEYYTRAISLAEQLAISSPMNFTIQNTLVAMHFNIGVSATGLNEIARAREAFDKAFKAAEEIQREFPQSVADGYLDEVREDISKYQ